MQSLSQTRSAPCLSSRKGAKLQPRAVATRAGAAWTAWDSYMTRRESVPSTTANESKAGSDLATVLKSVASSYKPKLAAAVAESAVTFKVQHVAKLPPQLPKELHARLETVGISQLKGVLGISDNDFLDAVTASFTTTDVTGALAVTGCVAQKGSDRNAIVALVASETEREASWSRLEGLTLHWACAESKTSGWAMPPSGWSCSPAKNVDADGAVNCFFEKQTVPGTQDKMYVLVMQLPLRGILKSGGLVFVLKAADAQNTRWLKDAGTDKDFWIDLQSLPVLKL